MISCIVRTLKSEKTKEVNAAFAKENEHYKPINQRVEFQPTETEKTVKIPLIDQELKALKEYLINAGEFDWVDAKGKSGYVKFGDGGQLSTNIGNNDDNATWILENMS